MPLAIIAGCRNVFAESDKVTQAAEHSIEQRPIKLSLLNPCAALITAEWEPGDGVVKSLGRPDVVRIAADNE